MVAERILWSTEARADLRAIDRETALRLLKALDAGDDIEVVRIRHRKEAYR